MANNSFTVSWFTHTCYTMVLCVLVPVHLGLRMRKQIERVLFRAQLSMFRILTRKYLTLD